MALTITFDNSSIYNDSDMLSHDGRGSCRLSCLEFCCVATLDDFCCMMLKMDAQYFLLSHL